MTPLPPDVPPLPALGPVLPDYLRRFALWAKRSFDGTVQTQSAAPSIMLLSPSRKTYRIEVDDAGTLTTTLVPPGRGAP